MSEWLASERKDAWYQTRVRLGALPVPVVFAAMTDAERRMLHGAYARFADALVEWPDRTELIEAKIVAHPVAVAQLELYKPLVPLTPSLQHRAALPVELTMLYAVPDEAVIAMARSRGIRSVEYRPPWVDDYLAELAARKRRAPLYQASA